LSQRPIPETRAAQGGLEAGHFTVSYLALHRMRFSVPPRLLLGRWALTPPFHPCPRPSQPGAGRTTRRPEKRAEAVSFLWHCLSAGFAVGPPACALDSFATEVTRHPALRCSDFPLPTRVGSDPPPSETAFKIDGNRPNDKRVRPSLLFVVPASAALGHEGSISDPRPGAAATTRGGPGPRKKSRQAAGGVQMKDRPDGGAQGPCRGVPGSKRGCFSRTASRIGRENKAFSAQMTPGGPRFLLWRVPVGRSARKLP
jgi:hypothetical protein